MGFLSITVEDVESIIASIGRPRDFDADYEEVSRETSRDQGEESKYAGKSREGTKGGGTSHLYRNSSDK